MTLDRTKKYIPAFILGTTVLAGLALTSVARAGESCCEQKKNHEIRVPGFRVNGPNLSISSTNMTMKKGGSTTITSNQGFISQGQRANSGFFFSGGGGGFVSDGPVPTVINNLLVDAEAQTKIITEQIEVPYTETIMSSRWVESVYVLQAVCMDDSSTPHPASRSDPHEQVDPNFNGELFRCMAGTWMQVTLGEYGGGDWTGGQFNNGSTIVCAKGEALVHRAGGQVACAAQTPRRNCNERSLLRKFGPGVKVVRISRQEQFSEQITKTRIETRTRTVQAEAKASAVTRTLILSGGVGGGG
ncbi:MAG: hypothetical protein COA47_09895 [Robiginitomaculum sp.]|nr:MAG: hypothetical protein COA47_09895 [Robiginitomaculum sp.]